VTLATSDRITHRMATAIFRIFLSEKVGYQNVTIVNYNTNWTTDSAFERPIQSSYPMECNKDEFKTGMINLEVWKPPSYEATQNIGGTVNCGSQGSGGRFGWYVTNGSLATDHGDITDHWRAFKQKQIANKFALSDDEDSLLRTKYTNINGSYFCRHVECVEGVYSPPQCRGNTKCATLFAGYFDSSSFLINQIKSQELLIQVMWIGPNLTPIFVEDFRDNQKALLFFSWWPNTLSTLSNILPVSFPPCTKVYQNDPEFACR